MATVLERQRQLLESALESLGAIADLAEQQRERDEADSQCASQNHRQAIEALEDERRTILAKMRQLQLDTRLLLSREAALETHLNLSQNREMSLSSQITAQNLIMAKDLNEIPLGWSLPSVVPYLDSETIYTCSFVCKRWKNQLLRANAFVKALKLSPTISAKPNLISEDVHLKLTLTIFQLDKFSYICEINASKCASCVSSVRTNESRLTIIICEREPAPYLKELVFARSALAIDKCIQDMNQNNAAKNVLLIDTRKRYEKLLQEKQRIDALLTSLSKSVLDLKTQCASDSHTLMFLERELESMSNELKFSIEREKAKRVELAKLRGENQRRRDDQEVQRNMLLKLAPECCSTTMPNINV